MRPVQSQTPHYYRATAVDYRYPRRSAGRTPGLAGVGEWFPSLPYQRDPQIRTRVASSTGGGSKDHILHGARGVVSGRSRARYVDCTPVKSEPRPKLRYGNFWCRIKELTHRGLNKFYSALYVDLGSSSISIGLLA